MGTVLYAKKGSGVTEIWSMSVPVTALLTLLVQMTLTIAFARPVTQWHRRGRVRSVLLVHTKIILGEVRVTVVIPIHTPMRMVQLHLQLVKLVLAIPSLRSAAVRAQTVLATLVTQVRTVLNAVLAIQERTR